MAKITKTELTGQQLVNEVKRINQRYVDLVKTFGAKNEVVQQYKKWLNEVSTVGKTKSGNLSIKKPSKLTEEDIKVIKKLGKLSTKGEYLEKKKELYVKLYDEQPIKQELINFANESSDIHEFITNNGTYIYNADTSMKSALKRSGTLTLDEYKRLVEIKQKYDKGVDIGDIAKEEKAKEQKASIPTGTLEE